jgi:hypothetical protein
VRCEGDEGIVGEIRRHEDRLCLEEFDCGPDSQDP